MVLGEAQHLGLELALKCVALKASKACQLATAKVGVAETLEAPPFAAGAVQARGRMQDGMKTWGQWGPSCDHRWKFPEDPFMFPLICYENLLLLG